MATLNLHCNCGSCGPIKFTQVELCVLSESGCKGPAKKKMGEKAVPSNVAELLVVRHGETTWNAGGRLQVLSYSLINIQRVFLKLNEAFCRGVVPYTFVKRQQVHGCFAYSISNLFALVMVRAER